MKSILIFTLSLLTAAAPFPATAEDPVYATVDRVEEAEWAVLEICINDEYFAMADVNQAEFNAQKREGERFELSVIKGKFYARYQTKDKRGCVEIVHRFISSDGDVEYALTEEEIGFRPNYKTEYNMILYDNGTPRESAAYDDVCIKVFKS